MPSRKRILYAISLLIPFLLSCGKRPAPEHSFYFWKTSYEETAEDTALIRRLGVSHFYIRYMDISWSAVLQIPVPLAPLQSYHRLPFTNSSYTPVVYIENRVFREISGAWIDSLAIKTALRIGKITERIEQYEMSAAWETEHVPYGDTAYSRKFRDFEHAFISGRLKAQKEIQIDCDWTAATKDKYFRFLRRFKKEIDGKKLSVTIRLYPYRHPDKMGIPPADKGVLMCYNISDIRRADAGNSVFELAALKEYLGGVDYKLPLDIALPVFGWYPWYRGGRLQRILYELPGKGDTSVYAQSGNRIFTIKKDTVIGSQYLREGDMIRAEFPRPDELKAAAGILKKEVPGAKRIIFYHWDKAQIKNYEQTIADIYRSYQHGADDDAAGGDKELRPVH